MTAARTPPPSSDVARLRMERQGPRDTDAEVRIRRRLHSMGLRFRVDRQIVPSLRRRADIVFSRARIAVLVDGCFWHGCPTHGTWPKANADWWREKIEANRRRDADTDRKLAGAGWRVIRVWEHEPVEKAADRIAQAIRNARI